MSWRHFADWAKRKRFALSIADRLGRSRGRLALLNHLAPPPPASVTPDLSGWEGESLAAVWLGHATVLLRIGRMTILTDPVLSNRVGVGLGLITGGPRRLVAPPLSVAQLPHLDLILLSHAHFDHLDRPTLARLPRRTPVIAARETADLVRDLGYRSVRELDWGESRTIDGVRITAHQTAHWGARTFYDTQRGYNAYLIESIASSPARRVLFGGDTAIHEGFRAVGGVDLAILGIGGYDPYLAAHATPEQAWTMAGHAGAAHLMPIHHSTFRLSYEPTDEPMRRLLIAAGDQASRIVGREMGEVWRVKGSAVGKKGGGLRMPLAPSRFLPPLGKPSLASDRNLRAREGPHRPRKSRINPPMSDERFSPRSGSTLTLIVRSLGFAFAGVSHLFRTQRNARIHVVLGALACGVGAWVRIARIEWAVLALTIASVLILEGLNTAIEAAVDLASPEVHPLAKVAKDVAAGMVLIAAIASVAIGLLILGPPVWGKIVG